MWGQVVVKEGKGAAEEGLGEGGSKRGGRTVRWKERAEEAWRAEEEHGWFSQLGSSILVVLILRSALKTWSKVNRNEED